MKPLSPEAEKFRADLPFLIPEIRISESRNVAILFDSHQSARISELEAQVAALANTMRNAASLARREGRRSDVTGARRDAWMHILRFAVDAGVESSVAGDILRAEEQAQFLCRHDPTCKGECLTGGAQEPPRCQWRLPVGPKGSFEFGELVCGSLLPCSTHPEGK